MNFRCHLLSLVRLHRADCEVCNALETSGEEMRRRLEELSGRTQPRWLIHGEHGDIAEVFDSKPAESTTRQPVSLKAQQKKRTGESVTSYGVTIPAHRVQDAL